MRTTTRTTTSRAVALLAGAAAAALVLTGCSGGGSGGAATAAARSPARSPCRPGRSRRRTRTTSTASMKDFEKQYPDAKVKLVDQPGDGYADKVLSQAVVEHRCPTSSTCRRTSPCRSPSAGSCRTSRRTTAKLAEHLRHGRARRVQVQGRRRHVRVPLVPQHRRRLLEHDDVQPSAASTRSNPPKTTDELFTQAETMHDEVPGRLPDEPQARPQRLHPRRRQDPQRRRHEVHLRRLVEGRRPDRPLQGRVPGRLHALERAEQRLPRQLHPVHAGQGRLDHRWRHLARRLREEQPVAQGQGHRQPRHSTPRRSTCRACRSRASRSTSPPPRPSRSS